MKLIPGNLYYFKEGWFFLKPSNGSLPEFLAKIEENFRAGESITNGLDSSPNFLEVGKDSPVLFVEKQSIFAYSWGTLTVYIFLSLAGEIFCRFFRDSKPIDDFERSCGLLTTKQNIETGSE